MAYGFIVLGVKYKLLDVPLAVGEKASIGFIGLLALLILIVCFFSFFWIREGQTTGMRAWRLKIINDSGHAPNKTQCIARCLLAPISLACFGLGYLWCLVDPHGMTIHDRMTRTRIALLPKDKK
jgi:uncharacterized RDD family membrane protein YckC